MTQIAEPTTAKTEYDKLFIGGRWVEPSTSDVIEVHSPATGAKVGQVPLAAQADVDAACAAARKAFDEGPWPRMTPKEREAVLAKATALIEADADSFKKLLALETGQPPTIVDMMQFGAAMSVLNFYASAADKFTWKDIRDGIYGQTLVLKEPIGVVGAVVAWNVPFFLAANKLGPALLAGCTIVLKPAAETPLTTNLMAEKFAEAGLPEGVLSVVPGGPETGRALTDNPELDKYTFTGSSAVGKEIGKIAAEKLKPCTLELGGKSAAIILEDADLDSTLPMLLFSGLMNTGQACVGQTRILAPRSRYDEIVERYLGAAAITPDNSFLGLLKSTFPLLMLGLRMTLILTAVSIVIALALGVLFGLLRVSRSVWLRAIGTTYVDIFRGTRALHGLANADAIMERGVMLPLSHALQDEHVAHVCEQVTGFLKSRGK